MTVPQATRTIDTPLGDMVAVVTSRGLYSLEFKDRRRTNPPGDTGRKRTLGRPMRRLAHELDAVEKQLDEYFGGRRTEFELNMDTRATDFQMEVWRALMKIPYGATADYAEIARWIAMPDAAQAVGQANAANPVVVVVPCHRVVRADGKLGGYSGGLWRKRRLLDMEAGVEQGSLGL